MEWCQAQNTVDSYSHALKSRKPAERLLWLAALRPGNDVAYREQLAANPGNIRAHTSHFHYYHKYWTDGELKTLRLTDDATCHAGKVHRTPRYPGDKLEENSYDHPLGTRGAGATGARGGAGGTGAGASGARRGGAAGAAAVQLSLYECNTLIPEHERNRDESIMVGPGWHIMDVCMYASGGVSGCVCMCAHVCVCVCV
jgi:hypothetical protein